MGRPALTETHSGGPHRFEEFAVDFSHKMGNCDEKAAKPPVEINVGR